MKRARREAAKKCVPDERIRGTGRDEDYDPEAVAYYDGLIRAQQLAFGRRVLLHIWAAAGLGQGLDANDHATLERLVDEEG